MTLIFSIAISIIFVLGIANGFLNLWSVDYSTTEKRAFYSNVWHKLYWLLKIQICVIIILLMTCKFEFYFSWSLFIFWGLTAFNFSWTIYDLLINVIRLHYENVNYLLYIDKKGTNKLFLKYLGLYGTWIFRFIIIGINIFYLIKIL